MQTRFVGWDDSYYKSYYDPSVISWISDAVMNKTKGLDQRPIRVSENIIRSVLDNHLNNHRPFVGDIHTRYIIPGDGNFSGDFGRTSPSLSSNFILNQVVEFISDTIRSDYNINTNNKRFSVWHSLYGANDIGLRAHSTIKLREKRPMPFQFHMKF